MPAFDLPFDERQAIARYVVSLRSAAALADLRPVGTAAEARRLQPLIEKLYRNQVSDGGAGTVTGEVPFRATATGNFDRVEFRLDNIVRAVSATSPADWTFDSTAALNGAHTLTVRAQDGDGWLAQTFAITGG